MPKYLPASNSREEEQQSVLWSVTASLRASDVVRIDSVFGELKARFRARAEANMETMKRAYNEIVIEE
jgi:hypothetical protein